MPITKFKLGDRGLIKEGFYADIVVMNPNTVTDKGDQLETRRYPEGVGFVLVNGEVVVDISILYYPNAKINSSFTSLTLFRQHS